MTFEYTDPDGDRLEIRVAKHDADTTVVALVVEETGSFAAVHIPLGRVEELIAGIRDTARQAAGEQQ
jgi:hypothetical protein